MAHIEENLPHGTLHSNRIYYREVILKKEGNKRWTEYYAVLAERQLIFNKKDARTGLIIPQNRTVLEITSKTSCAYHEKTCYRFPFYIRNEKGTYYFKCETNLQRYRWMYAVRLAAAGKAPEPPPKYIPTKHGRSRTSSQKRELGNDKQASVVGKRNMGYVKDEGNHGNSIAGKETKNSHGKDVLIDNVPVASSNHLVSTGVPLPLLANKETTNQLLTESSAWRKENMQTNGVSHPHSLKNKDDDRLKRFISLNGEGEVEHNPKNNISHPKKENTDPYVFKILKEGRKNSASSSHADLQIEDLDGDHGMECLNVQPSAVEDLRSSTQMQSEIFSSSGTGEPYIERFSTQEPSPPEKGTVRTDLFGNMRLLPGDLAPSGFKKDSRRSSRISRAQAQLLQIQARVKQGEAMKSQSWTSLNFIRSPMNTTQRRERSAPALPFSRHRGLVDEFYKTEAQIT